MVKRALISVSDKTGVVEFAKELESLGIEIISTGGTAKTLAGAGVKITVIQSVTGFPECLDGRLKTLHPKIHGGLLAMRRNKKHMSEMQELGVGMIDLLAVNLYPFLKTISKEGATLEEAIEQIDIGGPAMLRSAAKNWQDVTVLVDPSDYGAVLGEIERSGAVPARLNFSLARKVFEHTASYDAMIAAYLARHDAGAGESGAGANAASAVAGGGAVASEAGAAAAVAATAAAAADTAATAAASAPAGAAPAMAAAADTVAKAATPATATPATAAAVGAAPLAPAGPAGAEAPGGAG
ncbi:MAG: hypothetical protein LBJ10_03295, partial [Clostridiales bacterium]|nr:hypothetical protein [Clostridiales bacterium]